MSSKPERSPKPEARRLKLSFVGWRRPWSVVAVTFGFRISGFFRVSALGLRASYHGH